jgi:hypothetical protein
MPSTTVSARAKAASRVACDIIKVAVDFISCSPLFITASYR